MIQPTLRPSSRDVLKKANIDMDNPESDPQYTLSVTVMDKVKSMIPAEMKDHIKRIIGRSKR